MDSASMPDMTAELLLSYSKGALRNADELLIEASLLLGHGHVARAYFLAVACIEEAGKALLAFDSQSRKLADPAIITKLHIHMASHGSKIRYALGSWAASSPNPREALELAIDLISRLERGREPSMYSELRTNPDRVQLPREVVRINAARDCVRLADNSLAYAHSHVSKRVPSKFTPAQERMFTMKPGKVQEIFSAEDFWWYWISRIEAGNCDIAEAVLEYERDHIMAGTLFRAG